MHTDTAHWTRSEHLYKLYLRNPWNTIIVRGTNRRFSMENALVASPWINIKLNIAKPSIHLDIVLHDITKVSSLFTGSFSFSWNNRVDKSVVSMTRNDPWRARIPKSRIRRSRRTLCQKIWSINFDKTSVFSIKVFKATILWNFGKEDADLWKVVGEENTSEEEETLTQRNIFLSSGSVWGWIRFAMCAACVNKKSYHLVISIS